MHGSNLTTSLPVYSLPALSACLFLTVYCPSLTALYLKIEVVPSSDSCLPTCKILNAFEDVHKLLLHSYFIHTCIFMVKRISYL